MLKGKAIIELTDVNTGKIEKYEEENMITDIIPTILTSNPFFIQNSIDSSKMYPISNTLLGGILLFEEELEENPQNFYAPLTNNIIGYSNRSVNPGNNVKRGSFNSVESGYNDHSYKFVYDFNTVQGNGMISSLALTSNIGGSQYLVDNYVKNRGALDNFCNISSYRHFNSSSPATQTDVQNMIIYSNIIGIDINKNIGYSVFSVTSNLTYIKILDIPITKIGLNTSSNIRPKINSTIKIATSRSYIYSMDYQNSPQTIWGFTWSQKGNIIYWIKINLSDYSIEEGSITLETDTLYSLGNSNGSYYDDTSLPYYATYLRTSRYHIVHNNCLYCINNSRNTIIKISLNNFNIEYIKHPNNIIITPYQYNDYSNYDFSAFNVCNNTVLFINGYIKEDNTIEPINYTTTTENFGNLNLPLFKSVHCPGVYCGIYLYNPWISWPTSSYNWTTDDYVYYYKTMYLPSAYLATINNLETPIEKTNDKTMKITYILTEVEDEQ